MMTPLSTSEFCFFHGGKRRGQDMNRRENGGKAKRPGGQLRTAEKQLCMRTPRYASRRRMSARNRKIARLGSAEMARRNSFGGVTNDRFPTGNRHTHRCQQAYRRHFAPNRGDGEESRIIRSSFHSFLSLVLHGRPPRLPCTKRRGEALQQAQ